MKHVPKLNFQKRDGLIIVIIQDYQTKTILMHGFMNQKALRLTSQTGEVWLWPTSRQQIWHKGSTSDSIMKVVSASVDCDGDALLLQVEVTGTTMACHLKRKSCFVPVNFSWLKSQ